MSQFQIEVWHQRYQISVKIYSFYVWYNCRLYYLLILGIGESIPLNLRRTFFNVFFVISKIDGKRKNTDLKLYNYGHLFQFWDFSSLQFGSLSQNVNKSELKKSQICPISCQSHLIWTQIWHHWTTQLVRI